MRRSLRRCRGGERAAIALRATLIASAILLVFTLFGQPLLDELGVTIPALQTAGGIILLLIALDMIFAKPTSAFKLTRAGGPGGAQEGGHRRLPAGDAAARWTGRDERRHTACGQRGRKPVGAARSRSPPLGAVMVATLALLLLSHELNNVIGITAQRVLMRVFGILLASIAVQAAFNGIGASGLVHL